MEILITTLRAKYLPPEAEVEGFESFRAYPAKPLSERVLAARGLPPNRRGARGDGSALTVRKHVQRVNDCLVPDLYCGGTDAPINPPRKRRAAVAVAATAGGDTLAPIAHCCHTSSSDRSTVASQRCHLGTGPSTNPGRKHVHQHWRSDPHPDPAHPVRLLSTVLGRAKARLDRLDFYPEPVDLRHVALSSRRGSFACRASGASAATPRDT